MGASAGIAQLVERNLAKVEVAGSNPVSRSNSFSTVGAMKVLELETERHPATLSSIFQSSSYSKWLGGRVVMQRTATPCTPVRFRPEPPFLMAVYPRWWPLLRLGHCLAIVFQFVNGGLADAIE